MPSGHSKERHVKSRSIPIIGALAALLVVTAVAPVAAHSQPAGAVYTLSNAASGNAVIAYSRSRDGGLTPLATYATGGLGSGAGLGSQGAVTLSDDGRWLVAVDPGSDEVTTFRVRDSGRLVFADRIASGGDHPISATIHGGLVYVLNDGGNGNIAGFTINARGHLRAIKGSVEPLSSASSGPAQIAFGPHGSTLMVTEKATNRITTYVVRRDGSANPPSWISSAGETPFGFDFDARGHAIVSEASGGAPGASTVSSYRVNRAGARLADGPIATTQSAACWVVVTDDSRYAYVTNTGSGTITGLEIQRNGDLRMLDADGITGVSGGSPTDLSVSDGSRFLYVRTGGSIHTFRVKANGGLVDLGSIDVQPGITGLASS